ncbi:catechol o methyltransferase [Scheffersomyces amazonensis]|uniref:catechol o methyltransferase n=1 Tax=Scheffersomyces amazonensis TaxID=1078765 RepID=UPI00315D74B0
MPSKEQKILDYLFKLPNKEQIRGNPEKVLEAIDEFIRKNTHYMNVGPKKGKIAIDEIRKIKPKLMIELGCYFGYSAVLFAKELPENDPNAKYFSFELNPDFANIARQFVDFAGLSHKVEIIVGPAAKSLVNFEASILKKDLRYTAVDFAFIDHWKDRYVPDLRVLESLNLLAPGTLIIADNIYRPGAPDYLKYVTSSPEERREFHYKVPNDNGKEFLGRWNILYDTKTVRVDDEVGSGYDELAITKVVDYLDG